MEWLYPFCCSCCVEWGDGNTTCEDSITTIVNFPAHHQYQMYDDKNYEVVAKYCGNPRSSKDQCCDTFSKEIYVTRDGQ